MEDESDIITYSVTKIENGFEIIDTDEMIKWIDKWGIDHQDSDGYYMMYYCQQMTDEQLDIFFSYSPNIFIDVYYGSSYIPVPMSEYERKDIKPFLKFLEYDTNNRFVTDLFDGRMDFLNSVLDLPGIWIKERIKEVIDALENRRKQVLSLFQILHHKFEYEMNNKKSRIY